MKLLQSYYQYFNKSDYHHMTIVYLEGGKQHTCNIYKGIGEYYISPSITPLRIIYQYWGDNTIEIMEGRIDYSIDTDKYQYYAQWNTGRLANYSVIDNSTGEFTLNEVGSIKELPQEVLFQDSVCDNHYETLIKMQKQLLKIKDDLQ